MKSAPGLRGLYPRPERRGFTPLLVKDGRTYRLPGKTLQTKMAYRSLASYEGRRFSWHLTDGLGLEIPESDRHHPVFDGPNCAECAGKLICNGCSHCGLCRKSS